MFFTIILITSFKGKIDFFALDKVIKIIYKTKRRKRMISIIAKGLSGKVVCHNCGQLFDRPGILDDISCSCGNRGSWHEVADGKNGYSLCREPEICSWNKERLHAPHASILDFDYPEKGHLYLDQKLMEGSWILYAKVSDFAADISQNNDPKKSPWLVVCNQHLGYQVFYVLPAGEAQIKVAVRKFHEFVKEGREKKERDFLLSLKGKKALDNGTSNCDQHARRNYQSDVMRSWGWVNWESRRLTKAGAMTSDIWFENSPQGARDLVAILNHDNPERKGTDDPKSLHPEVRCWLDENSNILYVPAGTERIWIGKGGSQINKLSTAWGKRLSVKAIVEEQIVRWEIGESYVDGEWRTGIILTATERYTCGEKIVEFRRPNNRGGERIIYDWMKSLGVELRPNFEDEFPLFFCEELGNEPQDCLNSFSRKAVRAGKKFGKKTIEEWYETFFNGDAYASYIEAL